MMKKVKIFISYAKNDRAILLLHLVRLKKLMSSITHQKVKYPVQFWWDDSIQTGKDWEREIHQNLKDADIVIFMVSNNFLKSDFIQHIEIPIALERQESSGIMLMSVLVEECDYSKCRISNLEWAPKKSGRLKPLVDWSDKSECWDFLRLSLKTCIVNSIENLPAPLQFNHNMSAADKSAHIRQFAPPEVAKLHKQIKAKKKKKATKKRSLIGKIISFLNDKIN